MSVRPVIGWERETAVPNYHHFNDYLSARDGRLYFEDLDLAQLFVGGRQDQGLGKTLPSPLEIVYLPKIRQKIASMRRIFADVSAEVGYAGQLFFAYASKANAAEEVIRTTLGAGAHYEMSSTVDVEIARLMIAAGHLPPDRMVICNGFKPAGTDYAANIIRLKREHDNVIPVLEDLSELFPLIESGLPFDVGLRQKCYGPHQDQAEMEAANSRFGMDVDNLWKAAAATAAAPNLNLKLYHAMVGSQILSEADFLTWLKPPIEIYAQLRQRYPSLSIFDFGGGVPVPMTLDFTFDYHGFVRRLLTTLQEVCARYDVPVPDVMGEFGRYTTSEHGAHLFKVVMVKENVSKLPWYIIDGSIMTSFPDSWALGEHFIVLPLNHLDQPFRRVQLGGITCDSDDVYPPKPSQSPLYLPVETQDLYIGFFSIGAYQEMLGGVRGSKHCVLPEANELIVDRDDDGRYQFQILPGQSAGDVLRNLGYIKT
ncbi:MAG: arginine decarboxylase [Anaerolineae bacterium]|nr:arginine decarboxylase [Anaerolineae bacterium]